MSTKAASPGGTGSRSALRRLARWPTPDTLVWILLIVIAMIAASLVGLALSAL